MSRLVFQQPTNFVVEVSVCTLKPMISFNPVDVELTNVSEAKIDTILEECKQSKYILFPEYTYCEKLKDKYQNFSNNNNCVIIGGSGLEKIKSNFYAYCPVFVPNKDPIIIYKRNITNSETVLSGGRIIGYPGEIKREILIEYEDDLNVTIAIYVCYDFLLETVSKRNDILFIPQYENSHGQFISRGSEISKGYQNFVFGANNQGENRRSFGFAVLNNDSIENLAYLKWRLPEYLNGEGDNTNHHHSVVYDQNKESLMRFDINLGVPYSMAFNYSNLGYAPVFVPKEIKFL